jgi:hypothetical protein
MVTNSTPQPFGLRTDVLLHVQREMPGTTLRLYFTKNPYELPEYGNDVVAVLWLEERCKIPTYARHVRGVIHCGLQVKPFLGFHPRLGLNKYEAVLAFQCVRNSALHLRSRYQVRHVPKDWPPALHDSPRVLAIPLGYHSQKELPQVPMAERRLDAFLRAEYILPFLARIIDTGQVIPGLRLAGNSGTFSSNSGKIQSGVSKWPISREDR